MSLIEKGNLNYFTTVERFFLSLKDSGLSLSASDYHLISQWEDRGVPVRVLCRAIQKGFLDFRKRSRESAKLSLRVLESVIDENIQSAQNQ